MTIKQNPDVEYATKVRIKLIENDNYCPCQIERNDDTKCMCKMFREQLKRGEAGLCHCGLYLAEAD